jgi:hypothetical protein
MTKMLRKEASKTEEQTNFQLHWKRNNKKKVWYANGCLLKKKINNK